VTRSRTDRHAIQLRKVVYERLREAARKNGEQVETLLDGLLVQWLDRHGGEGN
jgi:hypothetical protein